MLRLRSLSRFLVLICAVALSPGTTCAQSDVFIPCTEMPELITLFHADHAALDRFYFVQYSPERGKRYQDLCKQYLDKLDAIDYNGLTTGCKVDYILFRRDLNEEIHSYAEQAGLYRHLHDDWFPFADTLYALEKDRRRGRHLDAHQVAATFYTITTRLRDLQKQLITDDHIGVQDVRSAREIIGGLQYAAGSVFKFYNGYDPDFTWWVPGPYRQLDSALTVYDDAFKTKLTGKSFQKDSSGIVGNPIGRDEIVRQLQLEMIPYTPEELIQIANKEFAWCDREMLKASREMGFGDNWKAALEKVKNSYVPPGDQPTAMLELYNESIDFLKRKDLVTIPPMAEETWRMAMMSPELQKILPFFYGGEEFAIAYPDQYHELRRANDEHEGKQPHLQQGHRTS
jgi:hypothetical protein